MNLVYNCESYDRLKRENKIERKKIKRDNFLGSTWPKHKGNQMSIALNAYKIACAKTKYKKNKEN